MAQTDHAPDLKCLFGTTYFREESSEEAMARMQATLPSTGFFDLVEAELDQQTQDLLDMYALLGVNKGTNDE